MPNDTFTPEQIAQILEAFFDAVGTRQYIGARYVPIFGRKDEESIEWDNTGTYEPLTIVLYQGNSYTSRQFVPVGVEITNQEFWALTGNYNAQVEQYRRETAAAAETANSALTAVNNLGEIIPQTEFSSANTVKDYIDNEINALGQSLNASIDGVSALLPDTEFSDSFTVKDAIDATNDKVDELGGTIIQNMLDTSYIGNLPIHMIRLQNDTTCNTQGACLLNDNEMICCLGAVSAAKPESYIYRVNIKTQVVENEYVRLFGHCNSICYNSDNNKLYMIPMYDENYALYNVIYVIDVNTLNIENTITVDSAFLLRTIMFDKETEKMYVGDSHFRLREFNYNTNQLSDSIIELNVSQAISYLPAAQQSVLANDIKIYNKKFYFFTSYGTNNNPQLYIFDIAGNLLACTNINQFCGHMTVREPEGFDFNSVGDIVFLSGAKLIGSNIEMSLIGLLPIKSKSVAANLLHYQSAGGYYVNTVRFGAGSTIRPDGSLNLPFIDPNEPFACYLYSRRNHWNVIYASDEYLSWFDNTYLDSPFYKIMAFGNSSLSQNTDIHLYCDATNVNVGNVLFFRASSSFTVHITKSIQNSAAVLDARNDISFGNVVLDYDVTGNIRSFIRNYGGNVVMSANTSVDVTDTTGSFFDCRNGGLVIVPSSNTNFDDVGFVSAVYGKVLQP